MPKPHSDTLRDVARTQRLAARISQDAREAYEAGDTHWAAKYQHMSAIAYGVARASYEAERLLNHA